MFHSRARNYNNKPREVAGRTNLLEFKIDSICMEFKSCLLRFVQVVLLVDVSMSHGGRHRPGWVAIVSAAYRYLRGGVDLTSPLIKRNLNISKDVRYGR